MDADNALTLEQINKMTVVQLRAQLSARRLSTAGIKKDLIHRLSSAVEPLACATLTPAERQASTVPNVGMLTMGSDVVASYLAQQEAALKSAKKAAEAARAVSSTEENSESDPSLEIAKPARIKRGRASKKQAVEKEGSPKPWVLRSEKVSEGSTTPDQEGAFQHLPTQSTIETSITQRTVDDSFSSVVKESAESDLSPTKAVNEVHLAAKNGNDSARNDLKPAFNRLLTKLHEKAVENSDNAKRASVDLVAGEQQLAPSLRPSAMAAPFEKTEEAGDQVAAVEQRPLDAVANSTTTDQRVDEEKSGQNEQITMHGVDDILKSRESAEAKPLLTSFISKESTEGICQSQAATVEVSNEAAPRQARRKWKMQSENKASSNYISTKAIAELIQKHGAETAAASSAREMEHEVGDQGTAGVVEPSEGDQCLANAPGEMAEIVQNILQFDVEMAEAISRRGELHPAQNAPSTVLRITNLSRPYVVRNLRNSLASFGTFDSENFWINRIRSVCIVNFNSLECAQRARDALDGIHWPKTNPRLLSVDYSTEENLKVAKTCQKDVELYRDEEEKENEKQYEPTEDVAAESSEDEATIGQQPFSKFNKTKAEPVIYYKPFTQEEVDKRESERAAAKLAELKKQPEEEKEKQQQQKEAVRKRKTSDREKAKEQEKKRRQRRSRSSSSSKSDSSRSSSTSASRRKRSVRSSSGSKSSESGSRSRRSRRSRSAKRRRRARNGYANRRRRSSSPSRAVAGRSYGYKASAWASRRWGRSRSPRYNRRYRYADRRRSRSYGRSRGDAYRRRDRF